MNVAQAKQKARKEAKQRFDDAAWNLYAFLDLCYGFNAEHETAEAWDIGPLLYELQEAGDEVTLVSHGKSKARHRRKVQVTHEETQSQGSEEP